MEYRHEIKFMVSDAQLERIRYRIRHFMRRDENQKGEFYTIRSLYFDDWKNQCLQDNLNGNDRREKYRIRIYDNDFSKMKLEKKSKLHTMVKKEFVRVDSEECRAFLRGDPVRILPEFSEAKKRLLCEMRLKGLQPKSIVEYDRVAYVYAIGNVRITFDRNVRGTSHTELFFDPHLQAAPFLGVDAHVLEVKYDELLPRFLYDALEVDTLQVCGFSKYCYSRR